jgi:hypothetical protein
MPWKLAMFLYHPTVTTFRDILGSYHCTFCFLSQLILLYHCTNWLSLHTKIRHETYSYTILFKFKDYLCIILVFSFCIFTFSTQTSYYFFNKVLAQSSSCTIAAKYRNRTFTFFSILYRIIVAQCNLHILAPTSPFLNPKV